MLQRAGVLTAAAEGAAWSGATTGITRSGRRGGSCRVTQDTASRTAAPSPFQSKKHSGLLLRVFLSQHVAPTQVAVEEDDDKEEKDAAGMPATVLGVPFLPPRALPPSACRSDCAPT